VAYSKQLKAYPLAYASNPGAGRYIDAFPKTWDTLPKYDLSYFEDLSTVVNEELVQEKDLAMMGMLPSLGLRQFPGSRVLLESIPTEVSHLRCADLLGHTKGLFDQIGGDRQSVGLGDRLLQFAGIIPIGGVVQHLIQKG